MSTHAICAVLVAACALAASGCEATITPAEPVVSFYAGGVLVPAAEVPTDVWGYPRVYFGGTYVYLVNGLWYQPTSQGWMVYRREPVELQRERTRIYAAPRVPRSPAYGYPRTVPREPFEYRRERTPR